MALHDDTVRSLRCVLDLGVGTRGPRIAWAAMHTRACAATGWGTPYLKIVVLTVFAPQDAGDEPPPCLWHEAVRAALCEHRRRGARGGVRGDLGRWSREAGQEGSVSHLLYGSLPFGGP